MGSRLGSKDGVSVNVGSQSDLDEVVGGELGLGGDFVRGQGGEVLEDRVDGEGGGERDAWRVGVRIGF